MQKSILFLSLLIIYACGSSEHNPRAIKGLAPTDIYLNMENAGFETSKNLGGAESGNFWENKKTVDGIDYRVTTYSQDIHQVETVKATALANTADDMQGAIQFFKMIASAPYEGATPLVAGSWIEENFNNDKATKTIGNAKFTIYAPSEVARELIIEKAY